MKVLRLFVCTRNLTLNIMYVGEITISREVVQTCKRSWRLFPDQGAPYPATQITSLHLSNHVRSAFALSWTRPRCSKNSSECHQSLPPKDRTANFPSARQSGRSRGYAICVSPYEGDLVSKVEGFRLGDVWSTLPEDKQKFLAEHLRGYV